MAMELIFQDILEGDFGSVEGQPFLLTLEGELKEDEGAFDLRIRIINEIKEPVAEATVKSTVTNPIAFGIEIPAIAVLYGSCVSLRIGYTLVDTIL